MLTAIQLRNPRGQTLLLPFVSSSGITVRDIEGLDPVAASLSTSSMAQQDGAQPQNARRDTRNILMKLGLEPDWLSQTPQSLREQLYDYLMTKANVTLTFYRDDQAFATTEAQVEDFQAPLFSSDPEADVSVICYDPDFYGFIQEVDSNTRSDQIPEIITYDGSSPAGIIFSMQVDRPMSEVTLYNRTPANVIQKMVIAGTWNLGDNLVVNTNPGQFAVTLIHNGLPIPAITGLDLTSDWLSLEKGDNEFRAVTAVTGTPYVLTYVPKYGGL